MGTDTNELKQGIDRTRGELGRDVDALAEKVTPGRIAERRMRTVRTATTGLRDRVMGSAEDAAESTGDAAAAAADTVKRTGRSAVQKAEGNPLATGLLVFAASWLASSMIPVSEKEKHLGAAVRDAAQSSGLASEAAAMASEVREGMTDEIRDSVEQVKATATDAAAAVTDEAKAQMPSASGGSEHREVWADAGTVDQRQASPGYSG